MARRRLDREELSLSLSLPLSSRASSDSSTRFQFPYLIPRQCSIWGIGRGDFWAGADLGKKLDGDFTSGCRWGGLRLTGVLPDPIPVGTHSLPSPFSPFPQFPHTQRILLAQPVHRNP